MILFYAYSLFVIRIIMGTRAFAPIAFNDICSKVCLNILRNKHKQTASYGFWTFSRLVCD